MTAEQPSGGYLARQLGDGLTAARERAGRNPPRGTPPADTIIGKHQRGKRLLESLH